MISKQQSKDLMKHELCEKIDLAIRQSIPRGCKFQMGTGDWDKNVLNEAVDEYRAEGWTVIKDTLGWLQFSWNETK